MAQPPTAGHLAESARIAAGAPATASYETHISASSHPIPAADTSAASAQQPHPAGTTHPTRPHACESKEDAEAAHALVSSVAVSHRATSTLSHHLNELLARAFATPTLSVPSDSAPEGPLVQPLEGGCHCLIIDESKLVKDSPDEAEFKKAMAMGSERNSTALEAHVRAWLMQHIPSADLACIYITHKGTIHQLHLNFIGLGELGRAQLALPYLVRCGAVNASRWNKPCGDVLRSKLPEVIHFSCIPLVSKDVSLLEAEARAFLAANGLEVTAVWCPSRSASASHQQRRGQEALVNIYALPRRIDDLASVIERMHQKVEFWGGQVRVDCPNSPKLVRCNHCLELGHATNKCELYRGLAIRLVMKKPLSYAETKRITAATNARIGYLGSGVEERVPSRRVTLLFEPAADIQNEQAYQTHIVASLASALDSLAARELLHGPPCVVDTKHRMRECRECGSMQGSAHACPFMLSGGSTGVSAPSSHPAILHPSPQRSDVCFSWAKSKTCPRLLQGKVCPHKHPEDIVPTGNPCYQFQRAGRCSRPQCKFDHPAAMQPSPLPSDQLAPRSVAQAAAVPAPGTSVFPPLVRARSPAPAVPQPSIIRLVAPAGVSVSSPARQKKAAGKRARASQEESDQPLEEEKAVDTSVTPAKKQKQGGALSASTSSPLAGTANPFAALSGQDDEDKGEAAAAESPPVTPRQRGRPRATAAAGPGVGSAASRTPSAPMSSLSALGSPSKVTAPPRAQIERHRSLTAAKQPASRVATAASASASSRRPTEAASDEEMASSDQE